MRVVQAAPATRWQMPARPLTTSRAARIERLALFVTTVVACLGVWLVYAEQLRTATGCSVASSTAAVRSPASCVNLTTVTQAAELAPALTMFPEAAERTADPQVQVIPLGWGPGVTSPKSRSVGMGAGHAG